MVKYPLRYKLEDEAHRHHLKLIGCGRLNRATLAAHKRLICEAVNELSDALPGETVIVEGAQDYIFLVVRSREDMPPRRCECCREAAEPGAPAGGHLILADDLRKLPLRKPSPPGCL